MIQFEDYHRTIVGYHGTRLSVALDIINRRRDFEPRTNDGDWLGRGVYFWEYAPRQALWWARRLRKQWNEPIAVLGSMIRLGACLDLLDPDNIKVVKRYHDEYLADQVALGTVAPLNRRNKRLLDCAVFEYFYGMVENSAGAAHRRVETARGAYVPTDQKKRSWRGSWIYEQSHIQICVRNPACILGTWLHYPANTGVSDVNAK